MSKVSSQQAIYVKIKILCGFVDCILRPHCLFSTLTASQFRLTTFQLPAFPGLMVATLDSLL